MANTAVRAKLVNVPMDPVNHTLAHEVIEQARTIRQLRGRLVAAKRETEQERQFVRKVIRERDMARTA
jgi:hypothetical protein